MDYADAYNNLADDIRTKAKSTVKRHGALGTKPLGLDKKAAEDENITLKYLNLVGGMFPEKEEPTELAPEESQRPPEGKDTGELVRPKGRYEVSKGEVQEEFYQAMIDGGLPEHVAQGFMMNGQDESGFKPDAVEAVPNVHGTRGKGILQLTGDRRNQYESIYGDDWSPTNQAKFLLWELDNSEKSAGKKILNTTNSGEAGAAIVAHFLRPAKKHRDSRMAKYKNSVGYSNS